MTTGGVFLSAILGLSCLAASAQQGFYREFYSGIEGSSVANLTSAPAFPNSPTTEEVVNSLFETPSNIAEAYGQRVRAVLTPTVTGSYTFWIATDDGGELWLGTDATPATRRLIASVNSWTSSRVWTSEANQKSALIALTAGTRYYIEALQKEGGGGDNLAVAWTVPGTSTIDVIPASAIQPYLELPAIKTQPASVTIYTQWIGLRNVSFKVEPVRKGGVSYQWQKDGSDIPGATEPVYTLLADLANSNRLFRCRLTNLAGSVTSGTARYNFVPDTAAPTLTSWSVYHNSRALTLTFSEPLAAGATNAAAFTIPGIPVLSARLLDDASSVVLALGAPLVPNTAYALSLTVSDCAVPANTLTLSGYAFTPRPLAATPLALLRPESEPPGPSSRRTPVAVTEIHYAPAARSDGRDVRFIELYNSNPFSQPLGGYRFSGAVTYTFPSNAVLPAKGYLVVAPSPADIAAAYGVTTALGGFDGASFRAPAALTLSDEIGAWLTTIAIENESPRPVAADGAGHSLVLARPSYGEREADGWAASARLGGSPGAAEPARTVTYDAVMLNEVLPHTGTAPGFVELYNSSSSSVSLAACVLKHGSPDSPGYVFPEGTVLPARGFLALDETALGFLVNGNGDTLWLRAPDSLGLSGPVIDVLRFGNQEVGVAYGRSLDGAALWSRLETPTPAAANTPRRQAEVALNEIMYHPISDDSDDEYIELYNPCTNAVDLTGWKLGGGVSYTFAETIAAKGVLVVPHSRSKLALLYPDREAAMTLGGYSGSLANSGDTVTLSKPVTVMSTDDPFSPVLEQKQAVIESVTYRTGGEWGNLPDGGGSSLERIDPRAEPRLARNWASSDETHKSEWTTLEFTGVIDHGFTASDNGEPNEIHIGLMDGGECLIDAVEVKAAGGANLVNNPSFEFDTSDWRYMGTHDRSSIESDLDADDGARVLHLRAVDRVQTGMNVIRGALSAAFPKSGTGTIRARVRWLSGSPELLIRTRGNWLEACGAILTTRALGTPGLPNSRAQANGAPAISEVIHQPLLPRSGEKVTVYARINDPDGITKATLAYRVEGQAGTNTVAMAPCTGGFFAGEIPAGQPANALVAFYVEAVDAHALTARSRFPANAPARECLVRFNEPLDNHSFGIYRFWMTQENLDYWASREKASNAPIGATFVYGNNRVLYSAAMMYGGSPWHSGYSSPINNGNIDYEAIFQNDDKVLDDDGMVLATVGNLGNDDIGIREQFCYSLVKALGQPHMNRRFVHLFANGTEQNPIRIFEDTEKPNAGVLKHWFPEDSNNDFFKIEDWFEYTLDITSFSIITATLEKYLTPAPDGDGQILKLGRYRWSWMKRAYETFAANDYTNFFGLVETLNVADSATYTQRLQEEVDIQSFASVIAMEHFIVNWDAYGFDRGKNMYLYDSDAGWALIAWDLDFNFGDTTSPVNPALGGFSVGDPTMRTFLTNPVAARAYWRAVEKLVAAASDAALRALTRAKYDALRADGAALNGNFDAFLASVDSRRAFVASQLAAANPAAFTVTSPAAASSTATGNTVTLSGIAPFAVTSLRINGVDTPITWTTPTTWTAQVVLNNGSNAFQIQAYNADGVALSGGSVTRTITYTGTPLDSMEAFLGFSEIMSAPVTNNAAYIELANRSSSTIMNLSRLYIDGAVGFTFPYGTILRPGEQLVVAEDADGFAAAYGASAAARVVGTYTGTLPPAGGALRLKRPATGFEPDDPVIDTVLYEAADPWPSAVPPGTSLQLINPALDNNRVANWSAASTSGQTVDTTPVPWNTIWKYYASSYPGDAWAATNFNDDAWLSGSGPLGWEADALPISLATSFALTGRTAYYFRTTFTFTGNPANATLSLSYMLDDGAAFFLNGQEVHRSSLMPLGDLTDTTGTITYMLPEGVIEGPFALPATALRPGVNTLAVRVHQNVSGSSDLVFGMKLDITTTLASTSSPGAANALETTLSSLPGVWLNEIQTRNVTGPCDAAGEHEPWVELYNSQTSSVSLAGWTLATATADPGWTFPTDAVLAPKAFLRVWLDGEPGESLASAPHAAFLFDYTDGLLLLRAPLDSRSVVVDYLRVAGAKDNAVWGAYPDGTSNPRRWLNPATPAASNRIDRAAGRIVINEFMAQNGLFVNPLTGNMDDWFELFNDGTNTVNLGGYVVTDTLTSEIPPTPDLRTSKSLVIASGIILAPGQALRIWTGASKSTTLPFDPANLQAPFGLSKDGDQICLFDPSLKLVDRLQFTTEQVGTLSQGRWFNGADGALASFALPTPGEPNRNPLYPTAIMAQPATYAIPEESPFCFTNTFVTARPANFVFRLFPVEGAALPTGLGFNTSSGVLTWTPTEAQGPGLYPLRVCGFVTSGTSAVGCDEVLLTLSVLETPNRPVIGTVTNITVNEGSIATFTFTTTRAEDVPPVPTVTHLRLEGAVPSNAVFSASTGLFTWQTGEADGPCTNRITLIAEDSLDPTIFSSTNITITVKELNSTFVYSSPATFYLWRNEPFAVNLHYADPDLPPNRFTYSLISGPAGLTLDTNTGLIQWQPTLSQTGAFSFRVRAFDNAGYALSTTINLSVDALYLQASMFTATPSNTFDLKWNSKRDTRYTIEWCPDLTRTNWLPVNAGAPVAGTGSLLSYPLTPSAFGSPSNAFFRIIQTRP